MGIDVLGKGMDVFSFWDKNMNESPLVVKMADHSWRKYVAATGSKYHKISEENIESYEALLDSDSQSTLINFRLNFQDLEPHWSWVHYTDCLRLALLEKFGGIWVDGTVCAMPELHKRLPSWKGLLLPSHVGSTNMEMESWFILCRTPDPMLQNWSHRFMDYCKDLQLRSQILGSPKRFSIDLLLREATKYHPALTKIWFSKMVKSYFRVAPYFAIYYMFSVVLRESELGRAYQYHLPFDSAGWTIFNRSEWLDPIPDNLENRILDLPFIKLCYKSNRGVTDVDSIPEGCMLDDIFSQIDADWRKVMREQYGPHT